MATIVHDWTAASSVKRTTFNEPVQRAGANTVNTAKPADHHIQLWHPKRTYSCGHSTYEDTYKRWPLPQKSDGGQLILPFANLQSPRVTSTNKANFVRPDLDSDPASNYMSRLGAPNAAWRPENNRPTTPLTTSNDVYKRWPLPPKPDDLSYSPIDLPRVGLDGLTTTARDFSPKVLPKWGAPVQRKTPSPWQSLPFEGTSTTHDHFTKPIVPPSSEIQWEPRTSLFKGTTADRVAQYSTTSGTAFRGWQLPPSQTFSLGVETVNDGFHLMIPATTPLPAQHTEVFTTVTDGETELEITVLHGGVNAVTGDKASICRKVRK
jgi:hypothetical protein